MITWQGCALEKSLAEREAYLRSLRPESASYVALNTCNRVELYAGGGAVPRPVARHLFRVAAGLESALPGETAVQGQVRRAYQEAQSRPLSAELHRLFQNALRVGKRARAETEISRGAMSHSQAVLTVLKNLGQDLRAARILIIGVNNINRRVIQYLQKNEAQTILLANRSYARACALSREFGCQAFPLAQLSAILGGVDILVSATAAPHLILPREKFTARQPLTIFDLAVPRDIDPSIGELSNVTLYNSEDLAKIVQRNRRIRSAQIAAAERIIEEEIQKLHY